MTTLQRNQILRLARMNYELLGCGFPYSSTAHDELVAYLYESQHGDEQRCLNSAILAHNLYNGDTLKAVEFFEWHSL